MKWISDDIGRNMRNGEEGTAFLFQLLQEVEKPILS